MLHTHSTIRFQQPPRHADDASPPVADVGSAANATLHADPAIRLALGNEGTIEECQALARAVVAIVPLHNGARIAGSFDGGARLHLLVDGWAYRASGLVDGLRQITDVLVPGDICDWMPPAPNEEIRACGAARVAVLHRAGDGHAPNPLHLHRERAMVADLHRLRARLTSIGRRDARGRIAYLMAELHSRLNRIGLVEGDAFACPLIQEQLGDLLGLTSVHVNRVLQQLRRDGVLTFANRQVVLPDLQCLHAIAGWRADIDDTAAASDRGVSVGSRRDRSMPVSSIDMKSRGLS